MGRSVLIAVITWVVVVLGSGEQVVRTGEQCRDVGAGSLQRGQQVISSRLYAGQTIVHVVSDGQPGPDYEPVVPSLEDVYFARIAEAERGAAVVA